MKELNSNRILSFVVLLSLHISFSEVKGEEEFFTPPSLQGDGDEAISAFEQILLKKFPQKLMLIKTRTLTPFGHTKVTDLAKATPFVEIDILLALSPSKGCLIISCFQNEVTKAERFLVRPALFDERLRNGEKLLNLGSPVVGVEISLLQALALQAGKEELPWKKIAELRAAADWVTKSDGTTQQGFYYKYRPPLVKTWTATKQ